MSLCKFQKQLLDYRQQFQKTNKFFVLYSKTFFSFFLKQSLGQSKKLFCGHLDILNTFPFIVQPYPKPVLSTFLLSRNWVKLGHHFLLCISLDMFFVI